MLRSSNKTLVVARHLEDVSWLADLPRDWKPWVVQKDVDVPNIGREGSSWLWAMQKLSRTGTVAFVQGNPLDHCPDLMERLTDPCHGFRWLGDTNYLSDGQGAPHDGGVPVRELHERWAGQFPGTVRFAAGGMFMLPGRMLHRWTNAQYAEMQELCCVGRYPWSFERLWEVLFGYPNRDIDSAPMGIRKKAVAEPAKPTPKNGPAVTYEDAERNGWLVDPPRPGDFVWQHPYAGEGSAVDEVVASDSHSAILLVNGERVSVLLSQTVFGRIPAE